MDTVTGDRNAAGPSSPSGTWFGQKCRPIMIGLIIVAAAGVSKALEKYEPTQNRSRSPTVSSTGRVEHLISGTVTARDLARATGSREQSAVAPTSTGLQFTIGRSHRPPVPAQNTGKTERRRAPSRPPPVALANWRYVEQVAAETQSTQMVDRVAESRPEGTLPSRLFTFCDGLW